MSEPGWLDVATPTVELRALTWGPPDGPVALCIHGFPDTAYGWRKVAPLLVDAGWRVVAPFLRGYASSSIPTDGSYHIGALMHDALQVLDAAGPTGRDVVIGHDWGAAVGAGLAAMPNSPFSKAVIMSAPPLSAFRPVGRRVPDGLRLAAKLPRQLLRSWYILYFQIPWLPERAGFRVVPLLWRQWSPNYDGTEDVGLAEAGIGSTENWQAAVSKYRTLLRGRTPPAVYTELHRWFMEPPRLPVLYLHGADDGCVTSDCIRWVERILPTGSAASVVEGAGHFLQVEQPDAVAQHIIDFLAR